jgi:Mg-chelatase subunit ChlD
MKLRPRLKPAVVIPAFILFVPSPLLWAGGAQESSAGARGAYVAEQGRIIPPEEIDIGSYVASIDYDYPDPAGEFGVSLYSGHRQVSMAGQEEIVQIGIQGKRTRFEDLPTLNLAFVFDGSGSMSEEHKIEWAKEAFELLLHRLRRQDILSVAAFSETANLLLPATRVEEITERKGLLDRVRAVTAQGASSLEAGLGAGYEQVLAGYRPVYVNRVVFVSDGLGSLEKAAEVVQAYRNRGVSLSTISVGMNCDLDTMRQLAKQGAGSSRFISNREKMQEIFSTDLDRMIVPIAYDLDLELELVRGTELLGTWGYEHRVSGNTAHYSLPALHHRDYETILVLVRLPGSQVPGRKEIARLRLTYADRAGALHAMGPYLLSVDYGGASIATGGISDPTVLKAGTMLHTAQGLKTIGLLYYSSQEAAKGLPRLNSSSWHNIDVPQDSQVEAVLSSEREEVSGAVRANKLRCLDLAEAIHKEILNTRLRLGEESFSEELGIVRKYIEMIGGELGLAGPVIARLLADEEIQSSETAGGTQKRLEELAEELALALEGRAGGSIAFFGFTSGGVEAALLQNTVDRITRARLAKLAGFGIIGEPAIEEALAELEVSPRELLDNTVALKAGIGLKADVVLVGRIVEMPASTVVFGKLLDCASGAVLSVAQVILAAED